MGRLRRVDEMRKSRSEGGNCEEVEGKGIEIGG